MIRLAYLRGYIPSCLLVFLHLSLALGSTSWAESCNDPQPPPQQITARPIKLYVKRYASIKLTERTVKQKTFQVTIDKKKYEDTLSKLENQINNDQQAKAKLTPERSGTEHSLSINLNPLNPNVNLEGTVDGKPVPPTFDYAISLPQATKDKIKEINKSNDPKMRVPIRVHAGNDVVDLLTRDWWLRSTDKPLAILTVGEERSPLCSDSESAELTGISDKQCHLEFLLARRIKQQDVVVGATVHRTSTAHAPKKAEEKDRQAEYPVQAKVQIEENILGDTCQLLVVNGSRMLRTR